MWWNKMKGLIVLAALLYGCGTNSVARKERQFYTAEVAPSFAKLTITKTNQQTFLDLRDTNAPPACRLEASADLINWFCVYRIQRCDGRTNTISVSWTEKDEYGNQYFWRIVRE